MSQYKVLINKYTTGKVVSDEELLMMQKSLVFMLKEIVQACNKYGLRPFVVGGNLLGKIRHGGFIPWDDDLDIGMLREDYNKFIEVFDRELSDRYVISAPFKGYDAHNRFIQVGRKGTILKSSNSSSDDDNIPTNHLYIDIFPYDYVSGNPVVRKLKGTKCDILMGIAGAVSFKKERNKHMDVIFKHTLKGRFELFARIVIGAVFSYRSVSSWMRKVNKAVENEKPNSYIACLVGRGHYFGELEKTAEILPLNESSYCGVKLYEINNPDAYLRTLYGDYMQIPPVEKRESHHAEKIYIPEEMYSNC